MSSDRTRSKEWQVISNLPVRVKELVEEFRRAAGETDARQDVPHALKQEHIISARNQTAAKLRQLQRDAEDALNEINKSAQSVLKPQPTSTNEALLAEIRRDRAWRRTQAVLDRELGSNSNFTALVDAIKLTSRKAALCDDLETLNALDEELPDYLQSKGFSLEERKAAFAVVDEARQRTYDQKQATVADEQAELKKLWPRVKMAATHGEYALKQSIHEPYSIPSQTDGELLEIKPFQQRHQLPQLNGAVGGYTTHSGT